MDILNIKDENGNWIGIPAIKGDKGDKGEPGAPAKNLTFSNGLSEAGGVVIWDSFEKFISDDNGNFIITPYDYSNKLSPETRSNQIIGAYNTLDGNATGNSVTGNWNNFTGDGNTVFGTSNTMGGQTCFAIGSGNTIPEGALGNLTVGAGLTGGGNFKSILGCFNKPDTADKYGFIIGNGTSDFQTFVNQSNALTIDRQGKMWVQDDVVVGGVDGDDASAISLKEVASRPAPVVATTSTPGIVKPDGTTITVTEDGTISAVGGGGSGSAGSQIYTLESAWREVTTPLNDNDKAMMRKFYKERFVDKNATFDIVFPSSQDEILYPIGVKHQAQSATKHVISFFIFDGALKTLYKKSYTYFTNTDTFGNYAGCSKYEYQEKIYHTTNIADTKLANAKWFIGSFENPDDKLYYPIYWGGKEGKTLLECANSSMGFPKVQTNGFMPGYGFTMIYTGTELRIWDSNNQEPWTKVVSIYYMV